MDDTWRQFREAGEPVDDLSVMSVEDIVSALLATVAKGPGQLQRLGGLLHVVSGGFPRRQGDVDLGLADEIVSLTSRVNLRLSTTRYHSVPPLTCRSMQTHLILLLLLGSGGAQFASGALDTSSTLHTGSAGASRQGLLHSRSRA